MRSSVSMMVALALVTACSSQPLTGNMMGTGGAVTGAGATGGFAVGATGGTGGAAVSACLDIANQYQQALTIAQACDTGADSACKQLVNGALSVCGSCRTYVTDVSKLGALQQQWEAENCFDILPKIPCPLILCLMPTSAVCAPAADGGTRGTCAPVYTGSGGSSGGPHDGGTSTSCQALVEKYSTALASAKSCAIGATDPCTQSTSPTLLPCRSDCVQFVNDTTELDAIRQVWDQQGCSNAAGGSCPPVDCSLGGGPACVATDASGPSCGTAVLLR